MAKVDSRPKAERKPRSDTVKPPASLPDASPFERMTELARRLINVPKDEAISPKKRKGRHGK